MAIADSRPGFSAHTRAVRATFPQVAEALREVLGARLVAYLGSVRETRAVHQWADGAREPSDAVQQRLRVALQVALMLSEEESPRIAQVRKIDATGVRPTPAAIMMRPAAESAEARVSPPCGPSSHTADPGRSARSGPVVQSPACRNVNSSHSSSGVEDIVNG